MIDGDVELLRMIRAAGTDMQRRREVGHFSNFPAQKSAKAAASAAAEEDASLEAAIHKADSWVLRLSHTVPLSEDYISRMRPWLTRLAQQHGGVYTGWDADADPPKRRGLLGRLLGGRSN
jgi:hypothetical protein